MRSVLSRVALILCVVGCEQQGSEPKTTEPEVAAQASAASTSASLNPEIAQAVAAAAKNKDEPASAADDNGPPPNGILPRTRADSEAPANSEAKLVLGATGSNPKLQLGGVELSGNGRGQMEVSVRLGPRSALPTTAFKFDIKTKDLEEGVREVKLDVADVRLGKNQPGEIPPELGSLLAKFKGSHFSYKARAGQPLTSPEYQLVKGGPEELETLLSSTADALGNLVFPLPKEPVGQGAFWMTTSREKFAGTDAVAYRMIKVTELTPERAVLDIETRRYAAAEQLGLPAIGPHTLLQFQSNDQAQMVFVPGQRLPVEGRMEMGIAALLDKNGAQNPVQMQTRALFSFPQKTRASKP